MKLNLFFLLTKRSQSQECRELQDRLYRGKDSQQCVTALGGTPDFPFNFINVNPAPVRASKKAVSRGNGYSSQKNTQNSYNNVQSSIDTQKQQHYSQQTSYEHSSASNMQHSHGHKAITQVRFAQIILRF